VLSPKRLGGGPPRNRKTMRRRPCIRPGTARMNVNQTDIWGETPPPSTTPSNRTSGPGAGRFLESP
jgi:hypothetical protein